MDRMQGKCEVMIEDEDFLCFSKEFGFQLIGIGEIVMFIFIFQKYIFGVRMDDELQGKWEIVGDQRKLCNSLEENMGLGVILYIE